MNQEEFKTQYIELISEKFRVFRTINFLNHEYRLNEINLESEYYVGLKKRSYKVSPDIDRIDETRIVDLSEAQYLVTNNEFP